MSGTSIIAQIFVPLKILRPECHPLLLMSHKIEDRLIRVKANKSKPNKNNPSFFYHKTHFLSKLGTNHTGILSIIQWVYAP